MKYLYLYRVYVFSNNYFLLFFSLQNIHCNLQCQGYSYDWVGHRFNLLNTLTCRPILWHAQGVFLFPLPHYSFLCPGFRIEQIRMAGSHDKKPHWFLGLPFSTDTLVFQHDKWELCGKLSQQFLATLTSLSTSTLRFCQGKPSDSHIILLHLQTYFEFACDKATGKGININQ